MPRMFDVLKKGGNNNNIMSDKNRNEETRRLNKITILAILVGALIFAEGSGLIFFANKSQKLSKELARLSKEKERVEIQLPPEELVKEQKELQGKYLELLKKFEAVKADRDNLIIQAKRLLEEKKPKEPGETDSTPAEFKAEIERLKAQKNEAVGENQRLYEEITQLKNAQAGLEAERDGYKQDYEKVKEGTALGKSYTKINEMRKEIIALKEENKKMQEGNKITITDILKRSSAVRTELEKTQQEIDKLKKQIGDEKAKAKADADNLNKRLAKLNSDYAEAMNQNKAHEKTIKEYNSLKSEKAKADRKIDELNMLLGNFKKKYLEAANKNKALEKEMKDLPRKFAEVSRQNQMLIKETGEMHYNLGVFYARNKEYERARAEFEKAIEINPEDANAHFNLGYLFAECLIDREKAIEHFRLFLNLAKGDDQDIEWAKKYVLTWETYEGRMRVK